MARSTWGSIKPKTRGVWELRYTVGGRRRSKTIRGTKAEAERELANLRVTYEDAPTELTVHQFWGKSFHPHIVSDLAESTVNGYEGYYRVHVRPAFGDTLLSELTPMMVQEWLLDMTAGAAKHAKAVLMSLLEYACTLGLLTDNVARRKFTMPKERAKAQRSTDTFTLDELIEIYEGCHGEVWEAAYILAAFGGASREESMSPRPEEIEEVDGFAVVPIYRGVQRLKGEVRIIEHAKNEYREDSVIVPPPYSSRLFELRDACIARGDTWLTDDGFGMPVCPNTMATAYKRWFLGRPLRYVPFSNLRNSYSTVMHDAGVPDSMVHKLMRHARPDTDYIHYNRPKTAEKIKAIKRSSLSEMGSVTGK